MQIFEYERSFARTHHLTDIRNWCLSRISMHSLAGDHENAQAITNEHMELLKQVDLSQTMWLTETSIGC
jgi:hypothetical protein